MAVPRSNALARVAAAAGSLVVAFAAGLAGCQIVYPLDDLPDLEGGPSVMTPDVGSTSDAGPDAAVSSDAAADHQVFTCPDGGIASAQLLMNRDFESTEGGACADFSGYESNWTNSPLAHGGAQACMVCDQAKGSFSLGQTIANAPVPSGHYYAAAWVRRGGGDAGPVNALLNLRAMCLADAGRQDCVHVNSPSASTTSSYVELTTDVAITASDQYSEMDVYVSSDDSAEAGDCMIVDDYSVYRCD